MTDRYPEQRECAVIPFHPAAWISHHDCELHDMGALHPESPKRLQVIADRLRSSGLMDFMQQHEAPLATIEQLARVHDLALIERILHADTSAGPISHDADTVQTAHSLTAALRAAGAGIKAVELTLAGQVGMAFCAVRPPGHHAERARSMGFCFFNNIAVAAAHALASGLERVAIIDFDLHYGNGTADIFAGNEQVWLYSTYQHPLYPFWTGAPHATNLVDVPLAPYAGSTEFRRAVTEQWLPALERQRPQLVLVSAGFDAHSHDPMGDLRFGYDDYRWIGAVLRDVAEACCDGKVVAMLEGGYDLHALARSVELFLQPFVSGDVGL